MKNDLLELLARIDLDLEDIEDEEEQALKQLEIDHKKFRGKTEQKANEAKAELAKPNPDYEILERVMHEYNELLYQEYEFEKQFAIVGETIATIDLEEIREE